MLRRAARPRLPKPGPALAFRRTLHIARQHIDSPWPSFKPYDQATQMQDFIAAEHHAFKASPAGKPPKPTVLSFTPEPTYTLGRRQKDLPDDLKDVLTAPLRVLRPAGVKGPKEQKLRPVVTHSLRGGLTTYHGPGQLVIWPILDLRSPLYAPQSVRSYARLLEDTTIAMLREMYGIDGARDEENPGVWVGERKIAAMGIHLRRHVATLGVAVNLDVPVEGGEDVNPWARFVPCGIEGRGVTSVLAEVGGNLDKEVVASAWTGEFERRLEKGPGA